VASAQRRKWLFKEEPSHYSFDDLLRDGKAVWDGVENNLALKHLREVRLGDEIMFYHTGEEKRVVGLMKAATAASPDPNKKEERFVVIDVQPVRKLRKPVYLSQIKSDPIFAGFDLVRNSRLSVMPVPDRLWAAILRMSET
jgi:predicted RNA-binding protein with PUA-like domain